MYIFRIKMFSAVIIISLSYLCHRISLMLTAFVVGCFIFGQASHTAEKDVSYSKFQIWRITPRTKDENSNFFRAIQSYGEMHNFKHYYTKIPYVSIENTFLLNYRN
jgi:hypothetical protein